VTDSKCNIPPLPWEIKITQVRIYFLSVEGSPGFFLVVPVTVVPTSDTTFKHNTHNAVAYIMYIPLAGNWAKGLVN